MSKRKDRERAERGEIFRNNTEVEEGKQGFKFRGFLNPFNTKDRVRMVGKAVRDVPGALGVARKKIMEKALEQMEETVREANKKRQVLTVDELIADYDRHPEFQELCEGLGLDRDFFAGMAEDVIKRLTNSVTEVQ